MFESESDLLVALQAIAKSVNKVLADGKSLVKAVEKLDSSKALTRQDYLSDAVSALKTADLSQYGCGDYQKELVRVLEAHLHALRMNAHRALIEGLTQGVENPAHLKILSDNPLVIYVHPLTLEVNFNQLKAVWTYAHEPLQSVSLDPDEILKAHKELVDTFRASRIDSQTFWQQLKMAYDMVLIKNAQPAGTRVDIVELLPALSWIWPVASVSKKGAFPRYLLAYQIQKLRSDGLLVNRGVRMELGTATGGSTRNKANVLYIPMGASEGQYYLSICFRQA